MDVVGIVQHHDGITGTAKQHVSDDYVTRIFNGIQETNPVYASIIDMLAQTAGIDGQQEWAWCQAGEYSTWQECPIADNQSSESMVVANHNPSNLASKTVEMMMPHSQYRV